MKGLFYVHSTPIWDEEKKYLILSPGFAFLINVLH